jgi:hypothetical protein
MKIRKRIVAAGTAGLLGVTGWGLVTSVAPVASAATADGEQQPGIGGRLQAIKDALAGLVTDGTITQEQADTVAETLDGADLLRGHGAHGGAGGPGGWGGMSLDAAAEALGMTADELRTALEAEGTTLAEVAEAEGVEVSALVDALVKWATERIDEAVASGRLTQEQADERIAGLETRLTEMVQQELRRGGRGPRGAAPGTGADDDDDGQEDPSGAGTTAPTVHLAGLSV